MRKSLIAGFIAALTLGSAYAAEPAKTALKGSETGERSTEAAQIFNAARLKLGSGTGTCASNAVTLNRAAGVITTEALTSAAGTTYTCTLTSSKIQSGDVVIATVDPNGSTGQPILLNAAVSSGSVAFIVKNIDASAALNAAVKIRFIVVTSGNPN